MIQPEHAELYLVASGQKKHGRALVAFAEPAEKLEPILAWQRPIQENQVPTTRLHAPPGRPAIRGVLDRIAFLAEPDHEILRDVGLVFDNQDSVAHTSCPLLRAQVQTRPRLG